MSQTPKEKTSTRSFIITTVLAVLAIVISVTIPEVRRLVRLDPPLKDTTTVVPAPVPGAQAKKSKPGPAAGSGKEKDGLYTYRGVVVDSLDRPVSGVQVLCSTCEDAQTTTDAHGNFLLKKRYAAEDEFRQEAVTFSKSSRSITVHLNWREIGPIKF